MFDLCFCLSLLPLFEPELEFFVFSPGGVALTGPIQNTQTNCSITPAATVSKPPPHSASSSTMHTCLHDYHLTQSSPWLLSHTCLHDYHLACWCPWLRPSTPPLHPPVPPLASNPACCLTLDLNTSEPLLKFVFCLSSHFIMN